MDAVELLERMEAACKTKCFCCLRLDSDNHLALRWMGELKVNKHGDKKEWGVEVRISPSQLRKPHHLDHSLEDAKRRMTLLFEDMAGGA